MDGFTNFLQPVPFNTLQTAADEGPVIIININTHHSDAIILLHDNPPVLVPLPEAFLEVLACHSSDLAPAAGHNCSKKVIGILCSLWDIVVRPIVDQLTALGVPERSHIWWCPISCLCALPLHAAGPYKSRQKNLPDIYLSSYTPTLSALITARSGVVHKVTIPELLVVGQPNETLPMVQDELDQMRKLGNFVDVLVGEEAGHDTVLHALQSHSWAHFTCHGHHNAQPFYSFFQLHNKSQLTLLELMKA